ncbi:MAG: hypothetical protein M3O28_11515 [Actinomycetota bacterium]|nr:hypothetical protein [Actinomycetota bacterium]
MWAEKASGTDCARHAFGAPVIAYLIAHPCAGMGRLLATTTVEGRGVGFSQISISFLGGAPADYRYADSFGVLVRQDGTGNVNDLLREGYRLPSGPTSVPSPDAFTTMGQDAVATVYDLWYLDGPTPNNDPRLVQLAQDIFLQY